MRHILTALALCLSFALPTAAHADSFQYTIIWDFPHIGTTDTSAFLGTYTFTLDSLLEGTASVYGPQFTDVPFPGHPYIYATDFTVPPNSKVSQIQISYFPDYPPFTPGALTFLYGFALYQANNGAVVSTGLLPDPNNPTRFFSNYGDGSGDFVSMEITHLSNSSPVPEPSTITLLGIGTLAIASSLYRRVHA